MCKLRKDNTPYGGIQLKLSKGLEFYQFTIMWPVNTGPTVISETSSVNSLRTSYKNPQTKTTAYISRWKLFYQFILQLFSDDDSVICYKNLKLPHCRFWIVWS